VDVPGRLGGIVSKGIWRILICTVRISGQGLLEAENLGDRKDIWHINTSNSNPLGS